MSKLYRLTLLYSTLLRCTYEECFSTQLLLCPHPLYHFMVQLSFTALHFTVLLPPLYPSSVPQYSTPVL